MEKNKVRENGVREEIKEAKGRKKNPSIYLSLSLLLFIYLPMHLTILFALSFYSIPSVSIYFPSPVSPSSNPPPKPLTIILFPGSPLFLPSPFTTALPLPQSLPLTTQPGLLARNLVCVQLQKNRKRR